MIPFWLGCRQNNGWHVQEKKISLTQLLNDADQGKIKDVNVNGADVTGHYRDDPKTQFETTIPANYPDLRQQLRGHGVEISIKDPSSNQWFNILISIAPFKLLFGLCSSCFGRCSPAATRP